MAKEKINLFEVVPYVSSHITTRKEGKLSVITFPRFPNKLMQKLFARFAKSEFIHIKLDENGTKVWDLIDGKRTVREISDILSAQFNGQENYEARMTTFISQLRANRFVGYKVRN